METLVAIDPGLNSSGLAVFEGRVLVKAVAVRPSVSHKALLDRVVEMGRTLDDLTPSCCEVAVEWPQVYTKGPNDRNDLLPLAGICSIVGALSAGVRKAYLPREWAGQLKKKKTGDPKKSPRGLYIERRLEGSELDVWASVKSHDAVDAIGIGLHHLGRMERKRVFPGAK